MSVATNEMHYAPRLYERGLPGSELYGASPASTVELEHGDIDAYWDIVGEPERYEMEKNAAELAKFSAAVAQIGLARRFNEARRRVAEAEALQRGTDADTGEDIYGGDRT